jgi:hypothetical protein
MPRSGPRAVTVPVFVAPSYLPNVAAANHFGCGFAAMVISHGPHNALGSTPQSCPRPHATCCISLMFRLLC